MNSDKYSKKNRRNNFLTAGAILLGVAAVGAGTYFAVKAKLKKDDEDEILRLSYTAPEEKEEIPGISFEEAYNIALEIAKKQFGENAFIVPASEKSALEVKINGEKRKCYMFGADKADLTDGAMQGLYHVDAKTGEVYDNGQGLMTKIS